MTACEGCICWSCANNASNDSFNKNMKNTSQLCTCNECRRNVGNNVGNNVGEMTTYDCDDFLPDEDITKAMV